MATKTRDDTGSPLTASAVESAVKEASRQKKHAAEYTGLAGKAVQTFTERWGIHKKAFGFARVLYDMEEDKREACLRDFLDLADHLGYFDQSDMFDDLGERVAEMREKIDRSKPKNGKGGDAAGDGAEDGAGSKPH